MKQNNTHKIIFYLSIASNVITVLGFFVNLSNVTGISCNPYFKYLVASILFTVSTFALPYFQNFFKKSLFAVLTYSAALLTLFLLTIVWPKGDCNNSIITVLPILHATKAKESTLTQLDKSGDNNSVGRDNIGGSIGGRGNVIINGNKNNVTITTKASQRKVTENDLSLITKTISDRQAKISVDCISNSAEDETYRNQIWESLTKLGYVNVNKGVMASQSAFNKNRLTIKPEINQDIIQFRIVVNPQQ